MNDNLPPGVSTSDLPGCSKDDMEFERWYSEHENSLLLDFIDKYEEHVVRIPAVKDWTKPIEDLFNDFVNKRWDNYKEWYYD